MDIGVFVPLPTYRVDVGVMARIAEEFGFESIWCADHPVMPVAATSRFPGAADGTVPDSYAHVVDPFLALARASGMTTRIRLGTGITLVPERNPWRRRARPKCGLSWSASPASCCGSRPTREAAAFLCIRS